jgi:hypothetical protein
MSQKGAPWLPSPVAQPGSPMFTYQSPARASSGETAVTNAVQAKRDRNIVARAVRIMARPPA